jgi:putative DNA methylase
MKGAQGIDKTGELGGTVTSSVDDTIRWHEIRQKSLKLIEVRGELSEEIVLPGTNEIILTKKGTIPKKSHFTCQENTCGQQQDILKSVKNSGKTGPAAVYSLQCYSPKRNNLKASYSGRYFKSMSAADTKRLNAAYLEWNLRKDNDLKDYWPKSELPYGFMTHHLQGGVPNHGFTHWYTMFNHRQLLIHALLLKTIVNAAGFSENAKDIALGAFEQYLRSNNSFTFYHKKNDQAAKHFSNNNFHPRSTILEVPVFSQVGDGTLLSSFKAVIQAEKWKIEPWELVLKKHLEEINSDLAVSINGLSLKTKLSDSVRTDAIIESCSSTDLSTIEDNDYDLIITDPPFGGLVHYSELADFFYVWLRLALKNKYPNYFDAEFTPKTLEAVANKARNPDDSDDFYKRILTDCWKEVHRILKPSGILSFTFHHSEDDPWVDVLESLFDAGFFLEATYPIRSDETKGRGEFGSKTIEYDIIHVCRKRTEEPSKISWPKLRRKILSDVRQLQDLLEHHQQEGLPQADIEVIKRGKALEYFSRHYGMVYVEEGREFSVKEALAGINQILDDQSGSEGVKAPDNSEPLTRQFLRIFAGQSQIARDQMQKYLRGSGVGPSDFIARGWCNPISRPKAFIWTDARDFAKSRKNHSSIRRDLDQAFYLIGACYDASGINVKKELRSGDFKPHPALGDLLSWLSAYGPDDQFRSASLTARQLYNSWAAENQTLMAKQLSIFDMVEE